MNIPKLISTSYQNTTVRKSGVSRLRAVVSFVAVVVNTTIPVLARLFSNATMQEPVEIPIYRTGLAGQSRGVFQNNKRYYV